MNLEGLTVKEIGVKTALQFIRLYENKKREARKKYESEKKRIESEVAEAIEHYNIVIKEIEDSIDEVYKKCEECGGTGYNDAFEEGARSISCDKCRGIGYVER